jgi:flagellar biosynthesis protein FlhG
MIRRYSITQVVEASGLEECEIRFFEQVFREFLTFSELSLDKNEFSQDHVDILCRIKHLIHGEGRSINEVKRELKVALCPPADRLAAQADPLGGLPPVNGNGKRRHARVIAVTSGKGGVGKTVVTVNLAITLAQMGQRVAIFDADLGLANVHILMGIKPRFNVRHMIEDNYKLEDIVTEGPEGIKVISGGQGVREMANLSAEQRRGILREIDRLEREVDVLIVDTGAGISENVLRFAAYADEVMVVTTPNIAAAADGYSIIKIILEMEPNSKIGLVANMAKNMYHSKNIFNRINSATRKYLRYPLGDLGYIVFDKHIEAASQSRRPMQLQYPNCEAAKCVRAIADTILNTNVFVNDRKDSSFGDMMGALKRTVVGV